MSNEEFLDILNEFKDKTDAARIAMEGKAKIFVPGSEALPIYDAGLLRVAEFFEATSDIISLIIEEQKGN